MENRFLSTIQEEYHHFEGSYITLGTGIYNGDPCDNAEVRVPLRTLNRHGLIAGATGTGKTVTLQVLAEQFSLNGIPTVLMDLKGDLSGLAAEGSYNKHIVKRFSFLSDEWTPKSFPLELLSLSEGEGTKLKATITEFGPVLMAKILDLNDTQRGILAVLFKYCDDQEIPLIDLQDLKKLLQFAVEEGKEEFESEYGRIHRSSVSTILRKILELEQQGADKFFAERSFDVDDLVRHDKEGNGMISIIRLTDIKDKPKLFSTFMLSLLAEIYSTFPEVGDLPKPKLCIFIDEAQGYFDSREWQEMPPSAKQKFSAHRHDIKKDDNYIILKHEGISYYFESKECMEKFTENPDEYIDKNKGEYISRKASDTFAKTLGYLALSGIALFLFLPFL